MLLYFAGIMKKYSIPVEPGLTNKDKEGQRVTGFNTESTEINEGIIRFDINFMCA